VSKKDKVLSAFDPEALRPGDLQRASDFYKEAELFLKELRLAGYEVDTRLQSSPHGARLVSVRRGVRSLELYLEDEGFSFSPWRTRELCPTPEAAIEEISERVRADES
jgi:hypothetical protein